MCLLFFIRAKKSFDLKKEKRQIILAGFWGQTKFLIFAKQEEWFL